MKRRKFITSSAMTVAAASTISANAIEQEATNEFYELKSYEFAFGKNRQAWIDYQQNVLSPALLRIGATGHMLFEEEGDAEPTKMWTLTAYPNADTFQKSILIENQPDHIKQAEDYAKSGKIYNRINSSLLYAFDGLKQMQNPVANASLFELRIYEGQNEDAVRRKIKMFNVEEIDLFYRTDLNPVFFGKMITGPYEPSLVYMLSFRDMDHRAASWKKFIEHPEWNAMKVKPEYANTVSNIRKIFLRPLAS